MLTRRPWFPLALLAFLALSIPLTTAHAVPPAGGLVDNDKDGYAVNPSDPTQFDCNDDDATIHPNAPEICGDGIDQDCKNGDLVCPLVASTPAPACGPGCVPATTTITPSAKAALAQRWGAILNPATGVITCTVPAGQAASGQTCWSLGYEVSGRWDWDAAPARYSITRSRQTGVDTYLFKGSFYGVEVEKVHAAKLAELETALAGKADAATVAEIKATIAEIKVAQEARDADFLSHGQRLTVLEHTDVTHGTRLDGLNEKFGELRRDLNTTKADVEAIKANDALQNEELRAVLRPGLAVEAGLQVTAGNGITNGLEGDDLAYRRVPMGLGLSVSAVGSVCSAEAACFLGQVGFLYSPRDTGGTGFGAYGNVGGEILVRKGFSAGPLVGAQWRAHGLRNGGSSAQSMEGAFGARLRFALPINTAPAVPGLVIDLQGLAGQVRHDPDHTGLFTPEMSGGALLRVSLSLGTPLRRTQIAKEEVAPAP